MKRLRIVLAAGLLAAGALVIVAANLLNDDPQTVRAAGDRYAVTVVITDPVEVEVTKGDADTVTLTPVMTEMGHTYPPVATRETGAGRFVARKRLFDMNGVWEITVTLDGPAGKETLTVNALVSR